MMNGKSKIEFVSLFVPCTCVDFVSVMTLEMEDLSFAFYELFLQNRSLYTAEPRSSLDMNYSTRVDMSFSH